MYKKSAKDFKNFSRIRKKTATRWQHLPQSVGFRIVFFSISRRPRGYSLLGLDGNKLIPHVQPIWTSDVRYHSQPNIPLNALNVFDVIYRLLKMGFLLLRSILYSSPLVDAMVDIMTRTIWVVNFMGYRPVKYQIVRFDVKVCLTLFIISSPVLCVSSPRAISTS